MVQPNSVTDNFRWESVSFVDIHPRIIYQGELICQYCLNAINKVEFIIASTQSLTEKPEGFTGIKINENFIGRPENTNAWIINFDETWDNIEKWRTELAPFLSV